MAGEQTSVPLRTLMRCCNGGALESYALKQQCMHPEAHIVDSGRAGLRRGAEQDIRV